LGPDLWHWLEHLERLRGGHLQHVRDRVAAVVDLECLAVVALATADLAGHVDIRQELHLDLENAIALAVLAAAALDVEREPAGTVPAHARLGNAREQVANGAEEAGVGGRVRAGGPPDRALVDLDDLVDVLRALERVVLPGKVARAADRACQRAVE